MASENAKMSSAQVREKETQKAKNKYMKKHSAFNIVKKVFKYAKPYRHYLILTFIFDTLGTVADILVPIFMGKAIGCAVGVNQVDFSLITKYVLLMFAFVVLG